jgi:hypothetical protein
VVTPIVTPAGTNQEALDAPPTAEVPSARKPTGPADAIAQTIVLAVLFATPALMCVHGGVVADPDVWWHMRTGQWMVEHHTLPRVDIFSAAFAGKPWAPYSWLFELLIYGLFQKLGLFGILGFSAALIVAITVAVWHLVKRLQSDFSIIILLTFATCYCLRHLYTPRPWLFTILFFVLELDILMHARKTGRTRELAWLPVIFALWSNLHIQFIDGLLVMALALAEAIGSYWAIGVRTKLRAPWLAAAFAGSVLATMINPFGWHIYRVAWDLATQAGVMNRINELQALSFRDFTEFLLLFLALAAAAALGWDRRFRVFEIGLLVFAGYVSFRSERDMWVMAMVAAAIIASAIPGREGSALRLPWYATTGAVIAASLAVLVGFRVMYADKSVLTTEIADNLPQRAVDEVKAKGYPGPLFNTFDWGGYLIWALRMPVSIDGRAAFYGDEAFDRSMATWNAQRDWASDPQLKSARLVIGPIGDSLTQILRTDPRYKLVYEDKLAAVFIARE